MLLRSVVAGVVFAVLASQPASAVVRISNDAGGQIGPYLDRLASLRSSGQTVVIDGPCLSACTLLLGIIPRERICVTPRAKLGFHAAWKPDANGNKRLSREGTRAIEAAPLGLFLVAHSKRLKVVVCYGPILPDPAWCRWSRP